MVTKRRTAAAAAAALVISAMVAMVSMVAMALSGCGGGGGGVGSINPTPTPSATATPTPGSSGTPTLTSVNLSTGNKNTILIFSGHDLTWPSYKMTIGGVDGTLLENANTPDGTGVSGFVQQRPSSLVPGVAYPIAIFVSNDGVHYVQAADPASGPLTFTYLS